MQVQYGTLINMYCKACGIKTEKDFCDARCEAYGDHGFDKKRTLSKYPRIVKCKKCREDFKQLTKRAVVCKPCKKKVMRKKLSRPRKRKKTTKVCNTCSKVFTYTPVNSYSVRLYCSRECTETTVRKTFNHKAPSELG